MDSVNIKFNNLKALCLQIDCENEWVKMLQDIQLEAFLNAINSQKHLSDEEVYNALIMKSQIDKDKLLNHVDKFKRYIEYFRKIIEVMSEN